MSDKHAMIERIQSSWGELMAAMEGLTDEQGSEAGVTGEWSVKDLMNHVAYWDNQARLAVEHYRAGGEQRRLDWNALNDVDFTANRDRPFDESFNRMLATHEAAAESEREAVTHDTVITKERSSIPGSDGDLGEAANTD